MRTGSIIHEKNKLYRNRGKDEATGQRLLLPMKKYGELGRDEKCSLVAVTIRLILFVIHKRDL